MSRSHALRVNAHRWHVIAPTKTLSDDQAAGRAESLGVVFKASFIGRQIMQTAKQEVQQLLQQLPEDCSIEDIQYHLYVLEKVKRGKADIEAGRVLSNAEVRERLQKWIDQ